MSEGKKLPAGWEVKKLGEVCEIVNGGTPKTNVPEYWNGKHLWVTPAEMGKRNTPFLGSTKRCLSDSGLKNSSAQLLPPYSVILSSRAPIGYLIINKFQMATNQGCKGLVPSKVLHYIFLYLFLFVNTELLNSLGTGATFKELSMGKLKEVLIPVPSIAEQERIVALLDEALTAIDKAKENAEKNLANARELFEGYLNQIFSNPGEGWEETVLSELASEITDGDHMPPPKSQEGIPFITISNINKETTKIDFSNTFSVPEEYYSSIKSNRRPKKGDILYTVTGSYGIPVLIDFDKNFCFQRHIGLIRPKANVSSKFIYYWILSKQCKKQAEMTATGTAQKTVSLNSLRNFSISIKPFADQIMIVNRLDEIRNETKKLESIFNQKVLELGGLRTALLRKAFTGKL